MTELTGGQRRYLRSKAHGLKPVVLVGQKQLTAQVFREIAGALDTHELIKVKCLDHKEKEQKQEIARRVCEKTGCAVIGMVGHVLTLYKQQPDPEKRIIHLPKAVDRGGRGAATGPDGSR